MKVGLLVIATNKYIDFVAPLWKSAKMNFLKGHNVTMFLFTDSKTVQSSANQIVIEQEHMPWPGPTLYRYNIFQGSKELLKEMDYLYYCDADMRFVDIVGEEVLGELVAVDHPGFYDKSRWQYTYETNPASKAYIGTREGSRYYAGGFNGGKTANYLRLADTIAENVNVDKEKSIVAVWHDESHLNRYLIDNPPTKVLTPSYCHPESQVLPFQKRLVALDKNHNEIRGLV